MNFYKTVYNDGFLRVDFIERIYNAVSSPKCKKRFKVLPIYNRPDFDSLSVDFYYDLFYKVPRSTALIPVSPGGNISWIRQWQYMWAFNYKAVLYAYGVIGSCKKVYNLVVAYWVIFPVSDFCCDYLLDIKEVLGGKK